MRPSYVIVFSTAWPVFNVLVTLLVAEFGERSTSFMQKFGGIIAPECGSNILENCFVLEGISIKSQVYLFLVGLGTWSYTEL